MPVEQYVAIVAPLKPKFIHHPRSKALIREVLADLGCDLEKTYLDVPRLRMVTSDGYLTSGVGYAHHLHRDTWYSAPSCQLNWWLPIYDIESDNSMAFHPHYWNSPVRNGSREFNYYEWNSTGRKDAATQIKTDTRKQPKAEEPLEINPQVRVVCEAGGIVLFSAAQMHSTVANTSGVTRYSMDFRTVHLDDVVSMGGAPNIDSACSGTSLRDFLRGTDWSPLPEQVVAQYDDRPVEGGVLVFRPDGAGSEGRTAVSG
jgi:phytanoyl-CoA dioxygenase PhyH